ncbi:unnamed protein product, partial [Callosobruchus maculatus]
MLNGTTLLLMKCDKGILQQITAVNRFSFRKHLRMLFHHQPAHVRKE